MLTAIYSGVRGSMRWALMPIYRGHGDYTLLFTVVFFFGMSLVRSMAWGDMNSWYHVFINIPLLMIAYALAWTVEHAIKE
ncbi:branched-chain amino acid transport permease [Edwardsiella ictaluri]|uniref:Branched-chain amino acid transport permease n=1 Tax=Edwardsiella ictaluri TaxID=67780 RepID=A0ABY8GH94_EDWIC|nr:hypothetical protein [Edwardsiella ictaluri]ELV7528277.1 branched-chain amino acid transport permease [Edwardsiella ictaluri]KMQ78359.1 branched-chain amino acid transport permease [Edwardsiella ictaluri]KOO55213.1 branched-chain amino acid transport permease [Edwardsiella ictaluri]UYB60862.1 branched-chain amino acid transport permease [Edwardsiella ictaluri]UYB64090.1 branched-chain amino acid transport permease [Edwardsiella ictaluri]